MADENTPAFYPRVGNIRRKDFKPAQPMPFIEDPRAMDLPQYGDVDLSVPSKENLEMSRRMAERDAQLRRQREADRSPLEKLAGGLETGRFLGSALTQGINSIPTRIFKGDEAADKFMQERMYKPEQPLAYEYAGDVGDFLEKLETQYKLPPILPEAVALQYLTGPATSQAARAAGRGAEQAGRAIERRMEPVVKGALEQGGLPREMVMAMGANTQSNVIKPKGGNWIGGSVEQALDPLITKGVISNREVPYGPEFDTAIVQRIADLKETASMPGYTGGAGRVAKMLEDDLQDAVSNQNRVKDAAINKWVQSNLTNYVKKDMGTPDDPVRKLAEQDISHLPQDLQNIEMTWTPEELAQTRKRFGFPEEETATNPTAKMWEQMADEMIAPNIAADIGDNLRAQNPWLEKLNSDDTVYKTMRGMPQALKFDHIIDVLREDIAAGRIRPEQLNKVSMEQAVRRTYEYDQEMARKMDADRLTARAELPVYKEYPEGLKWVELNRPGDFAAESKAMGHSVKGYEPPQNSPDWTEGSGDSGSSGYGLGGWNAIKSGKAKVYSLVDSKGEPHVTIEVGKEFKPTYEADLVPYKQAALEEAKLLPNGYTDADVREIQKQMAMNDKPLFINQIKGKQNAKPKDDYLPFVQDFVRGGNWSDVRDFQNTGFDWQATGPKGIFDPKDIQTLEQAGYKVPKYLTNAEKEELTRKWYELDSGNDYDTGLPKKPPTGMKRGGKVSISNNPDTMMLEVNNQKMAKGGLTKLLRAVPKSKAEIDAIARRMAPQLLGEFVRGDKGTQSVAGKTQKQFAKEKEMVHDIRPTGAERPLPREVDIEELKDQVMVGIAGDPTISGQTLYSVDGVPLESPSPQHGGPFYGLGNEDDAFWASGLSAANRVQNIAREASQQYDLPVLGNYVMMGPDSINYAQHYADANLAAINPAKMSRGQIEAFNKMVREGYPYKKKGEDFTRQRVFPAFPGIENPSEAYLHFSIDPELRKHFNALMQMPTVTEKYSLPSGIDVRHAVTEPDLRDLEIGVTGKSIGRLRPEVTNLGLSTHPTYSHDIPGEFLGTSKYPVPYELSFPDTVKSVRENPKQAPQEFGSFKYVGPRQVIDQQLIDEIKQYQEMIKKYTGKKKGGAVKKAEGGYLKKPAAYIDGNEFFLAAKKHGIKDTMNNLNMIVNLVNKGLSVDDAAQQVADSGMHKAAGGAISGDDLILEERPL
jgi:hypothetical protein